MISSQDWICMNTNCLKCLKPLQGTSIKYGLHLDCFSVWFKGSTDDEFVSLKQQSSNSPALNNKSKTYSYNTSFFHGMFKKYSADLGSASFILKMRQDDAPELPEVEYVCNQIGALIGIPVAEHYIINFLGDQTFVTKNFIKKGGTASDLSHIYKYLLEKQEYSCETLLKIIEEQTKRPFHIEVFIQTVLYDALIGNHDRHGSNLGLVVTPTSVSLSPIYDNVSYLGLEKGEMLRADFEPSGKIAVKDDLEPSMKEYVLEFRRLGHEDVVRAFHAKIKMAKIIELIDKSFCSSLMKEALTKMVTKRFKELENALT